MGIGTGVLRMTLVGPVEGHVGAGTKVTTGSFSAELG